MGIWSGIKDATRSVPIVGQVLGLDTPEEIAARAQQRGLTESKGILSQAYQPGMERYEELAGLTSLLPGLVNQTQKPFEFNLESDPSYQFARDEGLRGIENRLAARGLTGSGREMREMARFSGGLASQYAPQMRQQAFNERQQGLANLMGLVNIGREGLGTLTGMQTGLGGLQSGIAQESGNVDAARRMSEAAGIRNMINQGIGAAGMMMGGGMGGGLGSLLGGMGAASNVIDVAGGNVPLMQSLPARNNARSFAAMGRGGF
jgi:hypothetical protein